MRLLVFLLASLFGFSSLLFAQGTVSGRVIFEGTPPAPEPIEVKSDIPTCGTTQEVKKLILGSAGGVANAVVKVLGAPGTLEPKKGTLDQLQCQFVPHVQVLPVGSTLVLTSSDPVLHNAHGFYEEGSTAFNIAVPIPGMQVSQKLDRPGTIKLRCDAGHTWMSAYVIVTDQTSYAVTDSDGNFTIEEIPAGDYEIEVWHEWLGTSREPVTVPEGESKTVVLTLKGP